MGLADPERQLIRVAVDTAIGAIAALMCPAWDQGRHHRAADLGVSIIRVATHCTERTSQSNTSGGRAIGLETVGFPDDGSHLGAGGPGDQPASWPTPGVNASTSWIPPVR